MHVSSKNILTIDPPFLFKTGEIFNDPLFIAYETYGELNDKKDNATGKSTSKCKSKSNLAIANKSKITDAATQ